MSKDCHKVCQKCAGVCDKHCSGGVIDSISAMKAYKDCTIVDGALEISIRNQGGNNVVKALEEYLGSVKQIKKYLKIIRSYPLISLNFFKSLQRIDGKDQSNIALMVMDNQNLQDLFDPPRNLDIVRGGLIGFHYNPKLCIEKIKAFQDKLERRNLFDSNDSMLHSNGDKISCNVTKIDVVIMKRDHRGVILSWEKFKTHDDRSLLGYVVYYIEAPYKNITLYDGRDACGSDGWHIDDVSPSDDTIFHPITNLKAYTQYAYYVKTLMISSEKNGGQSDIQYFRTTSGQPDQVQKFLAVSNGSSEIHITWAQPINFNGEEDAYIITANLSENKQLIESRNYCDTPLSEKELILDLKEAKPPTDTSISDTCTCSKEKCMTTFTDLVLGKHELLNEDDQVDAITFEDRLHDWVYVKQTTRIDAPRKRRSIFSNSTTSTTETPNAPSYNSDIYNDPYGSGDFLDAVNEEKTDEKNGHVIYKLVLTNKTEVVLRNLKHFSAYTITVRACRKVDKEVNETDVNVKRCGVASIETKRTLKIPKADDIPNFAVFYEVTNTSTGAVKVTWEPPPNPNGIIVAYTIRWAHTDGTFSTNPICITALEYEKNNRAYYISPLPKPGNWSIQVRADSLAGFGNYTAAKYIDVPQPANHTLTIVIVCLLFVALIALIAAGGFYYMRQRYPDHVQNMKLIASVNPEYVSMQYTPDEWEVPRERIIQLQELGQGSFGMVYAGIIKELYRPNEEVKCAIKTVNENATDRERINFLKEASVMKGFDTHHVVKLLGVCSSGQPTLVVMELMANGDLKGYLRAHRPDRDSLEGPTPQPPTLRRIYQMAIEIADGMAYLTAKKFVHRDLAARNCMVAEDLTVKIGDFGMTRDVYETDYYRKGTKGKVDDNS